MLSSLTNSKVKAWMKLYQKKYRKDTYLILDKYNIETALNCGYLETLIYCGQKPFPFENAYEVSYDVMLKLTKGIYRDYIGIAFKVDVKEINKDARRILLLDDLQDPLNLGKILESALLFGFDSIILSNNTTDLYHEKTLNASKGAIFKLNIIKLEDDLEIMIDKLKSYGFKIYATGLTRETKELNEVKTSEKMAFILGNEGSGVKDRIMSKADEIVKIDMQNIDSLNVAMAASIVMYHFANIE